MRAHDAVYYFCLCLFVLLKLRCLRRCLMKFACWTIARSEVHYQCLQMVPDVSGSDFDEQAWSRLLAGAIFLWSSPTSSILECPPSVMFSTKRYNSSFIAAMGSAQKYVIQIYREHHLKLTESLSNVLQNRRLGITTVCSLLLDSQRDNTVCSWLCDESNWWDVPVEDRTNRYTLQLILQVIYCVQGGSGLPVLANYKHFNNLRASLWHSSHNFQIFRFHLEIVQTRCGNFMKLVNRLVRQFALAFNTFSSVTFHVAAPSCDVFGNFLFTSCKCADQLRKQFLFFHHNSGIDLCCSLSKSMVYLIKEWYWVVQIDVLMKCAHIFGMFLYLYLPCLSRRRTLGRITAFFDERRGTAIQGLSSIPILLQADASQIFCPTSVQPVDDRKDCAPAAQLELSMESQNFWSSCLR